MKTYAAGNYVVGSAVSLVVGKGGAGGTTVSGGSGYDGKVTVTWN